MQPSYKQIDFFVTDPEDIKRIMEDGYPLSPGWKESTTSRDAALSIAPSAVVIREKVLAAFRAAGERGLTADEAARIVMVDRLSVRPRVTELSKETPPKIIASERTRLNESTRAARVWVIA
jgi:predicted RNA-binding Zn ribbon-like protein